MDIHDGKAAFQALELIVGYRQALQSDAARVRPEYDLGVDDTTESARNIAWILRREDDTYLLTSALPTDCVEVAQRVL